MFLPLLAWFGNSGAGDRHVNCSHAPNYGNARTDVVPGLPEEGRRGVETEGRFLGLKILVDQLVPGWTR